MSKNKKAWVISVKGTFHREGDTATGVANGYKEWHIHGEILTEDEYKKLNLGKFTQQPHRKD